MYMFCCKFLWMQTSILSAVCDTDVQKGWKLWACGPSSLFIKILMLKNANVLVLFMFASVCFSRCFNNSIVMVMFTLSTNVSKLVLSRLVVCVKA